MGKMSVAFNTTVNDLEEELMSLILDGQIKARIDSHNKVHTCIYLCMELLSTVTYAVSNSQILFHHEDCEFGRGALRTNALIVISAICSAFWLLRDRISFIIFPHCDFWIGFSWPVLH